MKATTLPAVNAALVAAGVQSVLTFAKRPAVEAGERLAIHARNAGRRGDSAGEWMLDADEQMGWQAWRRSDGWALPVHFGCIVASAAVEAVVPIYAGPAVRGVGNGFYVVGAFLDRRREGTGDDFSVVGYDDQLPFADFTPGRWAVLLTDVARTEDRCPACWGRAFDCDHPRHGMSLGCICGVCDSGTCPPIPWRGHPGIWRWEP